jgi:hypothetical protein
MAMVVFFAVVHRLALSDIPCIINTFSVADSASPAADSELD